MRKFTRVMGFGTFDKFHPGHDFYLKTLKSWGDELVVIVARDQNVERIKGRPAQYSEIKRKKDVAACEWVDEVILGNLSDFYQVIRDFEPHVLGLGYDQEANEKELKRLFPNIEIRRVEPFKPEQYKSSLMK